MASTSSGYQRLPSWVLGFHGCDKSVGLKLLASCRRHLKHSTNDYDWLGSGIYFWENDPERALQFAKEGTRGRVTRGKIREPFVVGAVIDLGLCCNLFDQRALQELSRAYKALAGLFKSKRLPLPSNGSQQLVRKLDREVIEFMHLLREAVDDKGLRTPSYQTVRAPFMEGKPLYVGTTFRAKNHIQIAVRDPSCIKGYFLPRQFRD